jgi:hypothetical protein
VISPEIAFGFRGSVSLFHNRQPRRKFRTLFRTSRPAMHFLYCI